MEINAEECLGRNGNFSCQSDIRSVRLRGRDSGYTPVFSIVIPTWKRLETLRDTVESALSQTGGILYDIIVVEDNPEPGSEISRYMAGLDDSRISYYRNEKNLGLVGNFNRAVSLADARYVVLVHDDDFLFPDYLEQMARVLDACPDADIVCPEAVKWREYLGEPRPSWRENLKPARVWSPLPDGEPFCRLFAPTGITFRKDFFMASGGFDHESGPSTDLYYIVRAGQSARYYRYDKPLFVYRWAENESMKFITRLDFLRAGLPLRRLLLRRHHVPGFIASPLLKYYCWKSLYSMRKDFPDKTVEMDGLVLPGSRIGIRVCKMVTDAVARLLLMRRIGARKV